MLLAGEPRSTLSVRHVRLRGHRDELRARLRFERALAQLNPAALGLPPRALLVVRRVAIRTQVPLEHSAGPEGFGRATDAELRRVAGSARRIWLSPDAPHAEAVWFADESELAACLIRDSLGGRVADRWWWRCVLAGATFAQWRDATVLKRGELLVSAIAQLATVELAPTFVARLNEREIESAMTTLQHAYGMLTMPAEAEASVAYSADHEHAAMPTVQRSSSREERAMVARGAARLRVIVPELRDLTLSPAQRRLLGTAIVAARAPGLLRERSFVRALSHLQTGDDEIDVVAEGAPPEVVASARSTDSSRRRPAARDKVTDSEALTSASRPHPDVVEGDGSAAVTASDTPVAAAARLKAIPSANDSSSLREPERIAGLASPEYASPPHLGAASPTITDGITERAPRPVDRAAPLGEMAAQPEQKTQCPGDAVPTAFGGLFYLLNAAIALGIYGDFTTPRTPGIALSPWDLLALIGRRWFRDEIRLDPVWSVLATLAGRAPDEEPGREFDPNQLSGGSAAAGDRPARRVCAARRRRWIRQLADDLRARLAVALDVEGASVPDILCRHEARIAVTAADVDIDLALRDLPLPIRLAGLDRDCGWIPAAGRRVSFHFV